MAIVTLSGQIGANARDIGRLVADRLAIDYVDQEILIEAARDLGVPMESIVWGRWTNPPTSIVHGLVSNGPTSSQTRSLVVVNS